MAILKVPPVNIISKNPQRSFKNFYQATGVSALQETPAPANSYEAIMNQVMANTIIESCQNNKKSKLITEYIFEDNNVAKTTVKNFKEKNLIKTDFSINFDESVSDFIISELSQQENPTGITFHSKQKGAYLETSIFYEKDLNRVCKVQTYLSGGKSVSEILTLDKQQTFSDYVKKELKNAELIYDAKISSN